MGDSGIGFLDELISNYQALWQNPTDPREVVQQIAIRNDPQLAIDALRKLANFTLGQFVGVVPPTTVLAAQTEVIRSTEEEKLVRSDFLVYEAAILGGIVAAPLIYRAAVGRKKGKKGKVNAEMAKDFDDASNRAVALLSVLGPAFAFPTAYITVQGLENRGIITKKLGNDVQMLLTAAAAGPAISGFSGALSSLIKAVV